MGSHISVLLRRLNISYEKWSSLDDERIRVFFFDLETTGTPGSGSVLASTNRPLSIALRYGEDSREWRINPSCYVPRGSTAIHRITNEDAKACRAFELVFPEVVTWVEERAEGSRPVLVAHNAWGFDVPVLARACSACDVEIPERWRFYDTLGAYRSWFPDRHSKKLGDLYEAAVGTKLEGAHDASADTAALQTIFEIDLRKLFSPDHASRTQAYLSDSARLNEVKGIGAKTMRKAIELLGGKDTVGGLRAHIARAAKTDADVERFIRNELGAFREDLIFNIWRQLVQPDEPVHASFDRFPFLPHGFTQTPADGSQKFVETMANKYGIRSPDQLTRHYIYTLEENPANLGQWLAANGCPTGLSARLTRALLASSHP